jgi:malto-oligosyltrehalose synthase/malto-oligosyltrehalose trehalohydrolase
MVAQIKYPKNRIPQPGNSIPTSTYRLQLGPQFTFSDAIKIIPYLAKMGISHLYLSPILQPVPGSTHGYDVINHNQISEDLGGRSDLEELAQTAHLHKMGIVLDIVPNHMALPERAYLNHQLWDVLQKGVDSNFSHWFDIEWNSGDTKIVLPILNDRIGECIKNDEFQIEEMEVPKVFGDSNPQATRQWVLKYQDIILPVKAGTEHQETQEMLENQNYRLTYWRTGEDDLNYRRFFDIGTLIALKMDNRDVFNQTHKLVIELIEEGIVDCLRIDHPDGLANPKKYFDWLYDATGGVWTVAEKILAQDERLEDDWKVCGTTGYDMMNRIYHSMLNAYGISDLRILSGNAHNAGRRMQSNLIPLDHADVEAAATNEIGKLTYTSKDQILKTILYPDFSRVVDDIVEISNNDIDFSDISRRSIQACLTQILINFPIYRPYVILGEEISNQSRIAINHACNEARKHINKDFHETIDFIENLLLGTNLIKVLDEEGLIAPKNEEHLLSFHKTFLNNFSQLSSALTAKGTEDTVFYRNSSLISLCEVGGDLNTFSRSCHTLHNSAVECQLNTPYTMTSGTTHDTKRSEDIRAILSVLSENSDSWVELIKKVREISGQYRTPFVDPSIENAMWQTIVGTWHPDLQGGYPISYERLEVYLIKHMREAKTYSSWRRVNERYESALLTYAKQVLDNSEIIELIKNYIIEEYYYIRAAVLSLKAIQLTMPGVCDLYQGSETLLQKLVDPDNRTPVDFGEMQEMLDRISNPDFNPHLLPGEPNNLRINLDFNPSTLEEEKMMISFAALGLRRDFEDAFSGPEANYSSIPISTDCAFGFARFIGGDAYSLTITARYRGTLMRHGGYGLHRATLPKLPNGYNRWCDILTGKMYKPGDVILGELFNKYPLVLCQPIRGGVKKGHLTIWAPNAKEVSAFVAKPGTYSENDSADEMKKSAEWTKIPMIKLTEPIEEEPEFEGVWSTIKQVKENRDYFISVDDSDFLPDPASPMQKFGVHGPSHTTTLDNYKFDDQLWNGIDSRGKVFYEIHIGTFTPEGTFSAAIGKLQQLKDLGIDIIEIMPIAVFDGKFGWGYDGVDIYAINEEYGGPIAFQNFVNAAHNIGLGVCLDVVYNHLGPSGNYLNKFGPYYTNRHMTPWGPGFNFDGADSQHVRSWIIEHAIRSFEKLGVDCLRIDATHEIHDDSKTHILTELSEKVNTYAINSGKRISLIGESDDNDNMLLQRRNLGGKGLDLSWADDFHHALYSYLTGEINGYYSDYGTFEVLLKALKQGWVYDDQFSKNRQREHGTFVPDTLDLRKFVVCFSNHDQIGNRGLGDRPNFHLSYTKLQQAAALTLLSPFTPLIFQGEDWAASTPFQFFADFSDDELRNACRDGRKDEFKGFGWEDFYLDKGWGDVEALDPISRDTFNRSKLKWGEVDNGEHQNLQEWYRRLIKIRKEHFGNERIHKDDVEVRPFTTNTGDVVYYAHSGICVVSNFSDSGAQIGVVKSKKRPHIILSSDHKAHITLSGILKIAANSVCVIEYR